MTAPSDRRMNSPPRPKLRRAVQDALSRARQARSRFPEAAGQLQQLVAALEQAVSDVDNDREAQVLGYTKWVAAWLPDTSDPLMAALDSLESAAIEGA